MADRQYADHPVVGVGAVILEEGKVLLVRRGTEPWRGEWSLPGGVLELGETLTEAVQREVQEETGLAVAAVALVDAVDQVIPDEKGRTRFHYVLLDYLCRMESGRLHPASDVTDARWAARGDLPAYGLRPETVRIIEKAFELAK